MIELRDTVNDGHRVQNCHSKRPRFQAWMWTGGERDGGEVKLLSVPDILHQQMSLFMGIMVSSGNVPAAYLNTNTLLQLRPVHTKDDDFNYKV